MRSRDSLLFALVAAMVGMGAGFLLTSLFQGARPTQASGPVAARPPALQPRAPAERTPDTRPELSGVDRTTAVAPAELPQVRVPEAELERSLGSIHAPSVEAVQGGGVIRGEVQDESGMPLQGAVVLARQLDATRASDPVTVGGAPPDDASLDEHLRASARSWAQSRSQTRRAVSGPDGRFEVNGLLESASYILSAYLVDHVLEADGTTYAVSPGQRVVFRAEAVRLLPVQLVFEGGGAPAEGLIGVKRGNNERLYSWSSEAPVLRLTPGRVELRGYSGLVRAEGGRAEVDSSHASQELSLEVADQAGARIELVLTARSGIRGRVIDEFGITNGRQMVRLLALGNEGDLDLGALAESERYGRLNGDRFHLLDLAPGTYAIGLSDFSQALLTHELVTVAEGVLEVDLVVPEPDASRHLVVRAFGPSGHALRDLEFRWRSRNGGSSRSGSLPGRRTADGSFWLQPKADYFEPWGKETSYTLTIEHAALGQREIQLEQGQREVEVTYAEPVSLVVVVAGYSGSGYVGKLQLALSPATEAQTAARRMTQRMRSGNESSFSPEGVARFEGLAPGRWKVDLLVKTGEWETRVVQSVEVLASFGEQTISMDVPALYDLVVVAPGMSEGNYLFLNSASGEHDDPDLLDVSSNAKVGTDGRAVFQGLSAGDYVLRGNGMSESLEVTVPCADIYLDAKQPNCLRVAIGDLEGAMYKAGLRAGDLIIALDGEEFSTGSNSWGALLGDGQVELTVLRGGKTLAVPFQRIPHGGDWWSTLGGMLTPTTRP